MKTGLFKWNPDYLTAVHHFETAAKGFRRGAETKHYIAALMRAAECCDKVSVCVWFVCWGMSLLSLGVDRILSWLCYTARKL